MTIQKAEMQSELKNFMLHFAGSIQRIYGSNLAGGLLGFPDRRLQEIGLDEAKVENTMLWKTVNDMFDFGVGGIMISGRHLGNGELLDADFCDAEMFLRGLSSMVQYLEECETELPRLSILAARTAVARHVLEGGDRHTGFGEEDAAAPGLISIPEIALLADMDERSVRNAANPKHINPLVTVVRGKRTYVEIQEAKRWLSDRKGFVPTILSSEASLGRNPSAPVVLELSAATLEKLHIKANEAGVSIDSMIAKMLA